MFNLNSISIFGIVIDWEIDTVLFWFLIAQAALIVISIIVYAILLKRSKKNKKYVMQQPARSTSQVFIVQHHASAQQPVVVAQPEPQPEPEVVVVPDEPQPEPEAEPEVEVVPGPAVEVVEVDATEEVATAEAIAPVVLDEESYAGVLSYDKSFMARLIQSDDETKNRYTIIKNGLLAYKKVKERLSWKRETYRYEGATLAKISFRGKTLCLFLAIDPADYIDSKYKVEDASQYSSMLDTPCMYRIKNDKRARYAVELIEAILDGLGAQKADRESVDYYLPYEGVVQLIDKGLIKRTVTEGGNAFIEEMKAVAEGNVEEISAEQLLAEETTAAELEEVPVVSEEISEAAVAAEVVEDEPAAEELDEVPVVSEEISEETSEN